jgi:hypothetical protein
VREIFSRIDEPETKQDRVETTKGLEIGRWWTKGFSTRNTDADFDVGLDTA